MQQLLINELDKLEDLAWSTFKLERTPEQMEAMQDAIDVWLGAVIRKDWDSVRTFEIHIPAFFAIGLCRRNLEECKDPAESLALLVQTAVALGRTKMLLEVGKAPLDSLQQGAVHAAIAGIWNQAKSDTARTGGVARHKKDPKAAEKALIFECWQEWQLDQKKYCNKAAFARAMLDKCEYLESQKKIEDWCREWGKQ